MNVYTKNKPSVASSDAFPLSCEVAVHLASPDAVEAAPPIAIDFETYSTVELKTFGLHNYAVNSSTGAHCMAYGRDVFDIKIWREGDPFPQEIEEHLKAGGVFTAWNASFEWSIWNLVCTRKYGWPELPLEQLECSMAAAYAMSLPGSLEIAATVLQVDQQKDKEGSRVMLQLAKERHGIRLWRPEDDPEKFEELYRYCQQDVRTELAIRERLLELSPAEKEMWRVDQRINQRGVQLDITSVDNMLKRVSDEVLTLNRRIQEITGGVVKKCSEVKGLILWIREQGIAIESLSKASVTDILSQDIPDNVRAALDLRRDAAKTSTAKLPTMRNRASPDGRVRGGFQYHGASTGRWAHRGVQVGNFPRPRPGIKQSHIEDIIANLDNRDYLDAFHGPVMDAVADSLRALIIAGDGHELIACDFSAIEARGIAWLAGQESVLNIFRGHGKIYEHAASGIYQKPMEEVTKDERQIGKVAVLALGYGGGVGAFQAMARGYGVKVTDEKADEIKTAWRKSNREIVRYWYALELAAMDALDTGITACAGPKGREVKFRSSGSFLFCRLPSGRVLSYPYPSIKPVKTPWGEMKMSLHARGVNGATNTFSEYSIFGGLLAENITQAICRDLLAEAILRLEANKYSVVMHVHDEIVVEVPDTAPPDTLHHVETIVCQTPPWAVGFPISAEGWRGKRYRK